MSWYVPTCSMRPAIHDGQQIGQDQRLVVIVRHVDRGDVELLEQDLQIDAVFLPQRLIQIGEGLVQQEQCRVSGDAAPESHSLLLTARQGPRLSIQEIGELHPHELARPLILGLGHRVQFGRLLPEHEIRQDVRSGAQMRIERVLLKHHADAPITRTNILHVHIVVPHFSRIRRDQTGDDSQERGLAAPAGPQDDEGLAIRNSQSQALDGECRSRPAAPGAEPGSGRVDGTIDPPAAALSRSLSVLPTLMRSILAMTWPSLPWAF